MSVSFSSRCVANVWREREIRPAFGKILFSELGKDRALKFYLVMRAKKLGRASTHKVHAVFCLLGDLYSELAKEENPIRKMRDFNKYFPKIAPEWEINFLVPEELERLFVEAGKQRNRLLLPLIQFLAHTGMRRGEALALKWTDIDRESGFIHVRKSKNANMRTIPLEEGAQRAISSLDFGHRYVFSYWDGSRPDEDSFLKPLTCSL